MANPSLTAQSDIKDFGIGSWRREAGASFFMGEGKIKLEA